MKYWIKVTLIGIVILALILLFTILVVEIDNDKKEFCNEEGGYHEPISSICYKEDSDGDLVEYTIKSFDGKYKLIRK